MAGLARPAAGLAARVAQAASLKPVTVTAAATLMALRARMARMEAFIEKISGQCTHVGSALWWANQRGNPTGIQQQRSTATAQRAAVPEFESPTNRTSSIADPGVPVSHRLFHGGSCQLASFRYRDKTRVASLFLLGSLPSCGPKHIWIYVTKRACASNLSLTDAIVSPLQRLQRISFNFAKARGQGTSIGWTL